MSPISYSRHRFPPVVIQHAVWLYLRFTLSYRDVEELLAERGLDVSYETVRSWVLKFGPMMARWLRQRRPRPGDRRHLDEMVVRIAGKRMYLWRAVDHEGEILDVLVQRRRDKRAAVKSCGSCCESRPSRQRWWSPISCAPTALPSTTSGSPATTSKDFAKTIGPRTRTRRCDDASARCSGSNQPHPLSVS
jgi:DDE superfamily endonuclease